MVSPAIMPAAIQPSYSQFHTFMEVPIQDYDSLLQASEDVTSNTPVIF